MKLFDSHCHIHDERMPGGTAGAVEIARGVGVAAMVTVGCDRATSLAAIDAAGAYHPSRRSWRLSAGLGDLLSGTVTSRRPPPSLHE